MKKSFDELIKEYESLLSSNLLKEEEDGNKLTYFFNSLAQGLRGGKTSSFLTPSFDAAKNYYVLFEPKKNFDIFSKKVNGKGVDKCEEEIDDFIEEHPELKTFLIKPLQKEANDFSDIRQGFKNLQGDVSKLMRNFMSVNPKAYEQEEFVKVIENVAETNVEFKKNILSIKLYNAFYNALLGGQNWVKLSEIAKDAVYRTTKDNRMVMGKRKFSPFIKEDSRYLNESTHNLIMEIVKPTGVVFYMTPNQYTISQKGGFIKQGVNYVANDIAQNLGKAIYEG